MSLGDYILVNPVEDLIRSSGLVTVGDPASAPVLLYKLIHGTVITFPNVYPDVKVRQMVEEFVLLQTANLGSGDALQNVAMNVMLFNEDCVSVAVNNYLGYDSGYDDDDCIASFSIGATDWVIEGENTCRATVHPERQIKGTVEDANIGTNIYGVILAGALGVTPPTGFALKAELKLKTVGNIDG